MNRIIIRIGLISCLLAGTLFFGGAALAQDEEPLPEPGLLPDSPFYFFDKFGKSIGLFFTFGDEAKARKALDYAGERLAEARAMKARNKLREMDQAAEGYEGFMERVRTRLEATVVAGASDNISERVALATSRHFNVLDDLAEGLPEEAAGAVNRARTASMNGQENALRALVRTRAERALELNGDAIEGQLERLKARARQNGADEIAGELGIADRLLQLEEELTVLAEEQGIDLTAVRQRLAQSTGNRLEVLSGVYEQVPETARDAIAGAVENSFRKYERTMEQLRAKNALEDIPDEDTVMNRIQNTVRERLQLVSDYEADSDNLTRNGDEPGSGNDRGTNQRSP